MNKKKISLLMISIALITLFTSCEINFSSYIPTWMKGVWNTDAYYTTTKKDGNIINTTSYNKASYELRSAGNEYALYSHDKDSQSNSFRISSNNITQDVFNFVNKFSNNSLGHSNMLNSKVTTYTHGNQYLLKNTNNYHYINNENKIVNVSYSFDLTLTPFVNNSSKMYLNIVMKSIISVEGKVPVTYTYGFNDLTQLPELINSYTPNYNAPIIIITI